jgi:hypothetical protein
LLASRSQTLSERGTADGEEMKSRYLSRAVDLIMSAVDEMGADEIADLVTTDILEEDGVKLDSRHGRAYGGGGGGGGDQDTEAAYCRGGEGARGRHQMRDPNSLVEFSDEL